MSFRSKSKNAQDEPRITPIEDLDIGSGSVGPGPQSQQSPLQINTDQATFVQRGNFVGNGPSFPYVYPPPEGGRMYLPPPPPQIAFAYGNGPMPPGPFILTTSPVPPPVVQMQIPSGMSPSGLPAILPSVAENEMGEREWTTNLHNESHSSSHGSPQIRRKHDGGYAGKPNGSVDDPETKSLAEELAEANASTNGEHLTEENQATNPIGVKGEPSDDKKKKKRKGIKKLFPKGKKKPSQAPLPVTVEGEAVEENEVVQGSENEENEQVPEAKLESQLEHSLQKSFRSGKGVIVEEELISEEEKPPVMDRFWDVVCCNNKKRSDKKEDEEKPIYETMGGGKEYGALF